jgi:hypothetical protein
MNLQNRKFKSAFHDLQFRINIFHQSAWPYQIIDDCVLPNIVRILFNSNLESEVVAYVFTFLQRREGSTGYSALVAIPIKYNRTHG